MDFSYLKPPKQAMQIKHADQYIKYEVEGKLKRNVFYNVEFEDIEEEMIQNLQNLIKKRKVQLPQDWDKQTALKFCYSANDDMELAFQTLIKYLKWKEDPDYQILTQAGEEILKKGVIFSLGRDKQFRPLIFIQVSKISTNIEQLPPILNAMCVLLNYIQKFMLVPYYVEKWRIIVDLNDISIFRLPHQIIKQIIDVTQSNYTASLEQLHLLNPPFFLVAAWKLVERLMQPETAKKIQFCKDPSYLQEYINEDQLMLKYKGTLPNTVNLWPIINTYRGMGESIHRNMIESGIKQMGESIQKNHMVESAYLSMFESQYYTILTQKEIELSKPQVKGQCCACNIM
ncbi:unnamed protein product [Paramecium sonneborni]|uniref:CRAL-TRIO domain-containing protein n=1 Tax=Paramecium sonneborni TaxID=65129 RepID=A0A8S1KG43_9CILI|nr:unnamed protein product [Paramecium sonneborni]